MRALLILLCSVIAAFAAVVYVRSTESVGADIAGYGVNYTRPNALALGAAILFGLFAIALAIEGFTQALKNRPQPTPQPQIVIVPPWQAPPQTPPPENTDKPQTNP